MNKNNAETEKKIFYNAESWVIKKQLREVGLFRKLIFKVFSASAAKKMSKLQKKLKQLEKEAKDQERNYILTTKKILKIKDE
ncbi:MAG: hypothetical protein IH619_05180 [Ignavibacterium sp.]|nr:hypothetical protein [Ignavibacterium sp.]